jgi:hypothetical protein
MTTKRGLCVLSEFGSHITGEKLVEVLEKDLKRWGW